MGDTASRLGHVDWDIYRGLRSQGMLQVTKRAQYGPAVGLRHKGHQVHRAGSSMSPPLCRPNDSCFDELCAAVAIVGGRLCMAVAGPWVWLSPAWPLLVACFGGAAAWPGHPSTG